MKKLVAGLAFASALPVAFAQSQEDGRKIVAYTMVLSSFAAAKMCYSHASLYSDVVAARDRGLARSFVEEQLDVKTSPAIGSIVDVVYSKPPKETLSEIEYYDKCASEQERAISSSIDTDPHYR